VPRRSDPAIKMRRSILKARQGQYERAHGIDSTEHTKAECARAQNQHRQKQAVSSALTSSFRHHSCHRAPTSTCHRGRVASNNKMRKVHRLPIACRYLQCTRQQHEILIELVRLTLPLIPGILNFCGLFFESQDSQDLAKTKSCQREGTLFIR
jgi:hypothetical protein